VGARSQRARQRRCAIAKEKDDDIRINAAIRAREVRLIDTDGQQRGIVSTSEAQAIADERGLDLVEVAGTASPPVCRIMDFHKFRYEQRKRGQESRKKSVATAMKEVKIRSRTEAHDIAFKTGHIRRFVEKGHRVKISVFFKGREITRPDLGREMLDKVLESVSDIATPEGQPRMEGRHMSVVVVPGKAPAKSDKAERVAKVDKGE
jgi:translation initiation factor IF-3